MKRVVITGAAGFVGGHLIDHLLSLGDYTIYGTYRSQKPAGESENLHFIEVELKEKDAVERMLQETSPDWVIHLAAQSSVGDSLKDPLETLTNNVSGELQLLEALKNANNTQARVLIVSTVEVYGLLKPEDLPVDEETPLRPGSPYAVSKIAQEYLALQYQLSYQLGIVRVRPFHHFGPRQSPKFVMSQWTKNIVEIEKGMHSPLMQVGNLNVRRDYTDVRDIVRGYVALMEKGAVGEVYNMGRGESYLLEDILHKMFELAKVEVKTEVNPAFLRPVDTLEIRADISKIKNLVGWEPKIPLEETLTDMLEYWRQNV